MKNLTDDIVHQPLGELYDTAYLHLCNSKSFFTALKVTFGDEYCDVEEQLSYVRRSDIQKCNEVIYTAFREESAVLDIGCGAGGFTRIFSKYADHAVGLDISEVAVRSACDRSNLLGFKNTSFVNGSFLALPFEDGAFSVVIALDSIQHARPFHASSREIARVLKPGGTLIFTNWLRLAPLSDLKKGDPLYVALEREGLEVISIEDTDPGLARQVRFYIELANRKAEIESEVGSHLLQIFLADARHIGSMRKIIQRGLSVAVKQS
ncbi:MULTISPECIES: class I SAM-dependent methyltransferase [Burkholderia cepacia complex]|uniref:class I SAM-dependent methyltransferase n=1 Tax=Burkholderia cepacia complex TaxID=87882 RepID=UPI0009B56801|nr:MULTISPECIES: class I SAM-dependent methyltransferase [Burkholderia cepacia complex]